MPLNRYIGDILKSLRGERLGLDHDNRLVGHNGVREPNEALTSASTAERSGVSILSGSTAVFTLRAPLKAGIAKEFINASSITTATMSIVRSTVDGACSFLSLSSAFGTSAETAAVRINLLNVGASVKLRSISSAIWAPIGPSGSSLYYTNTTSS